MTRIAPSLGRTLAATLGFLALCLSGSAHAITAGQVETFEDGSTGGWFTGAASPVPVENVADGGPGGIGDNFLLVRSSGGAGAGSRLVVMNDADWIGDLLAAGVTGVRLDARNLGDTDIELRLRVESLAGAAMSIEAASLPVGSGWTTLELSLRPEAISAPGADAGSILAAATLLRLYHGTSASFPGPASVAILGIDNVTAVPEPDGRWLSAAGLCVLAAFVSGRRTRAATRPSL